MENQMFTNTHILSWLQYFSEHTQVDLEKVKILDITRKNKNLIPTVESHSAVLVFTEAGHPDIFYRMWDAGLGDCEVWYNEGSDPSGPILHKPLKDMINRGGEKIVSSDVEKALLDVEGVEEATVVGIPHAIYGEAPAALVKCAPSALWNEEGLRAALKSRIAGYKIPVRIRFTPNGKYNKKAIRDLFRQQSGTARQQ